LNINNLRIFVFSNAPHLHQQAWAAAMRPMLLPDKGGKNNKQKEKVLRC
jgi:hypothetical protein